MTDSVTYTVSAPNGCPDPATVHKEAFNVAHTIAFSTEFDNLCVEV